MPDARTLARTLCNNLTADELEILRDDPFEAIPIIDPAVQIDLVSYEPAADCSVEGLYQEATRSITVQRAASRRRTRFTAIHEFGHDRARHDTDVARYLASLAGNASRTSEERAADAFAAAVLIPDGAVDEVLHGNAPTTRHIIELFHRDDVAGSREACCVRIAERMRGEGYVIVAEGDRLRFCATVGGAFPIRRGTAQGEVALLRRAAESGSATDENTRLQFPDGRFTGEYAGQAITDDIYTFAVLVDSTTPPWGGWVAPRRIDSDAPEVLCAECDEFTEAWKRCETDPSHRVCSACGWCECRAARVNAPEKTCDTCTTLKRLDLFPDGGTTCRDCV